ncbi:MAG: metal ABC transporter permease [Spirochaetales bacterium]|nr:metal ABC transporter permease [Spirochaetales bacterium]
MNFFQMLFSPEGYLLRNVLLAGIFAAVAFGVVGTYIVVNRITYIAGAIAHSVLGGIGVAFYFGTVYQLSWLTPMVGAVVAALLSALIIGVVSIYSKEREDTIISVIWVIGMALGIIFIDLTPVPVNVMSYLFGNILLVSSNDIFAMLALDFFVIIFGILFYNRILSISFDKEYSQVKGVKVNLFYIALLCVTALAIVILVRVVGIVMLIAFLTLPSAIAGQFSSSLWKMMIFSSLISALSVFFGTAISYETSLPTGATIVILIAILYLFVILFKKFIKKNNH